MTEYKNKGWWIFIVFCCSGMAVIMMMNSRIQRGIQTMTETPRYASSMSVSSTAVPAGIEGQGPFLRHRRRGQKVVRKDRLSPGREYVESVFYLDGREIGRQNIADDKVVESSGEIPDGKVDFVNEFKKTYGVEYYAQGKKDGPSKTYFADGRLNAEAYYRRGELLRKTEYYNDGGIRLEVNYEDARKDTDAKENGVGKVYYRDGTLKYEWHLTNSENVGFKKSYTQDGELRAVVYFDENGQMMK
jgi:antitoxin component YwqK of YwqJK toxin-antitoxin module